MNKPVKPLNETEQLIYEYIEAHLDEIPALSSKELGRRTATSSSSVIRLIRKLGYASYVEFRTAALLDFRRSQEEDVRFGKPASLVQTTAALARLEAQVIEKTQQQISLSALECARVLLDHCETVLFFANDAHADLAQAAARQLGFAGKSAFVLRDGETQLLQARLLSERSLPIFISRHGQDTHLVQAARILKEREIPALLLTSRTRNNPLQDFFPYRFYGVMETELEKLSKQTFTISLKYLLDLFFVLLLDEDLEKVRDLYEGMRQFY